MRFYNEIGKMLWTLREKSVGFYFELTKKANKTHEYRRINHLKKFHMPTTSVGNCVAASQQQSSTTGIRRWHRSSCASVGDC